VTVQLQAILFLSADKIVFSVWWAQA